MVELMIVMAVVVLLAAIAAPNVSRARQTAEDAKTEKELQSIYTAIVMYQVNNGFQFPMSWADLVGYITVDESKYEINPT